MIFLIGLFSCLALYQSILTYESIRDAIRLRRRAKEILRSVK